MERHADELGGAERTERKPGRQAARGSVEDHPLDYGDFEGTIPKGEYGGGTVMLWDTGTWEPQEPDVEGALKKGKLAFMLHGERLHGKWALVRLRKRSPKDKDNWLLIKELDDYMRRGGTPSVETETTSVTSGRSMDEIAAGKAVWHSNRKSSGASKGDPEIVAGPAKTASTDRSGSKKKPAAKSAPLKPAPSKRSAKRKAAGLRRTATRNAGRRPAKRK